MIRRLTFSATLLLMSSFNLYASENDQIISGGRLYDIWWVDAELTKPADSHPSYPAEGRKKRATTWRCKECHGWDYKGKDGAYGTGSHFTGINGIQGKAGANVSEIVALLQDNKHQFGKMLPEKALNDLALFVIKGQINMGEYIDPSSKKAKGDAVKGKKVYDENCLRCHGEKGTDLGLARQAGFKSYMGDVSNDNPWETLHKIRFGHPGSKMGMTQMQSGGHDSHEHHHEKFSMDEPMPAMFGKLSSEQEKDLLSYIQTLLKASAIKVF